MDKLVGRATNGLRSGIGSGGMKNDLPLALVEEQTKGEITADESRCGSNGDGFDEPDGIDCFGLRGRWLQTAFGRFCGGARHEGAIGTLASGAGCTVRLLEDEDLRWTKWRYMWLSGSGCVD